MSVQSVNRALELLRTIAINPEGLGVTELARQTGLHKSTVYRLVSTLEEAEAIERIDAGSSYAIRPSFAAYFDRPTSAGPLINTARPYLTELSNHIGEDAGLALLDGDHVIYVDQVASDHALQVRDWVGMRFPLHEVAAGRIILAYQPSETISKFQKRWSKQETFVDLPVLIAQLLTIRRQGHAWILEPKTTGLNAVAAPIFDATGKAIASIGIYGPDYRFPDDEDRAESSQLVMQAAQALSGRLGFRPN